MRLYGFIFKSLFVVLILFAASCSQKKSTSEAPSEAIKKTDSAEVTAIEPKEEAKAIEPATKPTEKPAEKPLDKPTEKPIEKKEVKPVQPKKEEPKLEVKKEEQKPVETIKEPEKKVVEVAPAKEPVKKDSVVKKVVTVPKKDSVVKKVVAKKGKPFYFRVVRKEDGKEVVGNLQLQEIEGATQYQLIKSGEVVYLEKPKNRRGAYHLAALIPGYKQSEIIFVYDNPPIETGPNNEDIVTITLDKAKSGDYIDFTNVHFYPNSSVMRPVSQAELDELASLLMEDPKYKIKIYGYCNGKQDRDSYLMGTSTNFFALDAKTNKKEKITSKDLSLARAENVKAYLVSKGVAATRISTKGEGGAVPLYSETGNQSQYNDRVEVEFVK
ncbi:MAG: OmpA family protein [Cyclobacteriaceae bacterium]